MSASNPNIRPARHDEYPAIGELTHAAYSHDYSDLPEDYKERLRHPELLLDDYDIWVATEPSDGTLLGTIAILRAGIDNDGRLNDDELYFRLLAVAPAARGRGIGQALTKHTVELARQRGLAKVVLNSGENMVGAHALYRKLGFAAAEERQSTIVHDRGTVQLYTFVYELA
jgi:ribosomal protein S18 acetylase RimI-like enzyme